MNAIRNFKNFDKSGFDNANKTIIVFIIIISIVVSAARQNINIYTNSGAMLLLLFFLTLGACYLELLDLTYLELMPGGIIGDIMSRWGVSVIVGLLAIVTLIKNARDEV